MGAFEAVRVASGFSGSMDPRYAHNYHRSSLRPHALLVGGSSAVRKCDLHLEGIGMGVILVGCRT